MSGQPIKVGKLCSQFQTCTLFWLCMWGLVVPDQINLSVQAYPWKGGSTELSEPSLGPLLDYEHSMTTRQRDYCERQAGTETGTQLAVIV